MRMEPLMETLQKSDGEEMHLEPGERVYVVKRGQRSPRGTRAGFSGSSPSDGNAVVEAVPVVGIGSEDTYDRARVRKRNVPSRVHETKRGYCRDHPEEWVERAPDDDVAAARRRSRCRADSGCTCRIGGTGSGDSAGADSTGADADSTSRSRSREPASADAAHARSPEGTGSERSRRDGSVIRKPGKPGHDGDR